MKSSIKKTRFNKFRLTLHPTWQYYKKRKWSGLCVGITAGVIIKTLTILPLTIFLIGVLRRG